MISNLGKIPGHIFWWKRNICFSQCVHSRSFDKMENIFTAVRPFYILTKVLGLFPKSFVGTHKNGFLKLKWHGVAYSCLSLSLLALLFLINIFFDEPSSSSELLSKLWRIDILAGLLLNFIQFCWQIEKQQSIAAFLVAVHTVDEKVRNYSELP